MITYQVLDNPEYQQKYQYVPEVARCHKGKKDSIDKWMVKLSDFTYDAFN